MYETYCKIRDSKGLRDSDVAKGSGLSPQIFTDWKRGKGTPKAEKLLAIADFLDVPIEYLITGEMVTKNGYFLDEESAKIAQVLHDDSDLLTVMDTTRNIPKEDIKTVIEILKRFEKK